ncbi:hypothetical protein C1878_06215 [Gordonibacter sp. 28C]|uniref:helix-turn-helix transcriptional regulator n=1 Tax=Gordonibacter sp. 28C TaxID=2078569 RepID=UPI000DF866E1|nr:helix-turn-helix transcriptional regulator [Gordonibacter sp. 28C]RDB62629.1 hypothetical protein C1878_06215 [Gordonibacter sp. 28C]
MTETEAALSQARPYVAVGGLVGVVVMLMDNPHMIDPLFGSSAAVHAFFRAALVAAMAAGLLLALRPWRSPRRAAGRAGFGSLLAACAFVGAWGVRTVGLPEAALVLCGAAFGVGFAVAVVRWGSAFSALDERVALFAVALAGVAAALLKLLALALSDAFPLTPSFVVAAGLVASAVMPRPAPYAVSPAAPSGSVVASASVGRAPSWVSGAFSQNWEIVVGLLLCAFISASQWGAQLTGVPIANNPGPESAWGTATGFLVGSALLCVAVRRMAWRDFKVVYQLAPLVCVASLQLIWFFGALTGTVGRFAFSIPLGCAIAVMAELFWVRLSTGDSASLAAAWGVATAAFATWFLAVVEAWPWVGDDAMSTTAQTGMVLYLVAVGLVPVLRQRRRGAEEPTDLARLQEERCRHLAERAQLSRREAEILSYLAQGRSAPFIAEELFVSTNTVKTHVRHIYGKLGVHSKEELLDVVHDAR